MRAPLLRFLALSLFICPSNAHAQTETNLPERKPFILNTLLVDKGKPNAIIVSPEAPEYNRVAKKVQEAIYISTGARLQIVNDGEVANKRGELKSAPVKNMIVLGNLSSSGLIAHLYFRSYCAVDAVYPGRERYVVQTVCDP